MKDKIRNVATKLPIVGKTSANWKWDLDFLERLHAELGEILTMSTLASILGN